MAPMFLLVNGLIGTTGSYLIFRKFRNLGLLLAGLCLVAGSAWSAFDNQWTPMMGLTICDILLAKLVGNPLDL